MVSRSKARAGGVAEAAQSRFVVHHCPRHQPSRRWKACGSRSRDALRGPSPGHPGPGFLAQAFQHFQQTLRRARPDFPAGAQRPQRLAICAAGPPRSGARCRCAWGTDGRGWRIRAGRRPAPSCCETPVKAQARRVGTIQALPQQRAAFAGQDHSAAEHGLGVPRLAVLARFQLTPANVRASISAPSPAVTCHSTRRNVAGDLGSLLLRDRTRNDSSPASAGWQAAPTYRKIILTENDTAWPFRECLRARLRQAGGSAGPSWP